MYHPRRETRFGPIYPTKMSRLTLGSNDLLEYNSDYGVLICRDCEYAIQKSAVSSRYIPKFPIAHSTRRCKVTYYDTRFTVASVRICYHPSHSYVRRFDTCFGVRQVHTLSCTDRSVKRRAPRTRRRISSNSRYSTYRCSTNYRRL